MGFRAPRAALRIVQEMMPFLKSKIIKIHYLYIFRYFVYIYKYLFSLFDLLFSGFTSLLSFIEKNVSDKSRIV